MVRFIRVAILTQSPLVFVRYWLEFPNQVFTFHKKKSKTKSMILFRRFVEKKLSKKKMYRVFHKMFALLTLNN